MLINIYVEKFKIKIMKYSRDCFVKHDLMIFITKNS